MTLKKAVGKKIIDYENHRRQDGTIAKSRMSPADTSLTPELDLLRLKIGDGSVSFQRLDKIGIVEISVIKFAFKYIEDKLNIDSDTNYVLGILKRKILGEKNER